MSQNSTDCKYVGQSYFPRQMGLTTSRVFASENGEASLIWFQAAEEIKRVNTTFYTL